MSMRDFIGCHVLIPELWTICQPIEDLTITCYTLNRLLKEYSVESENRKKLYEEEKQLPSRLNSEFQYSWISINVKKKINIYGIYTPFISFEKPAFNWDTCIPHCKTDLLWLNFMTMQAFYTLNCKDSYIYFIHLS